MTTPDGQNRRRATDAGYVLTFFLVAFTVTLLVVTGLTVDGGRILAGRRAASNAAFTAARVGAQSFVIGDGGEVVLDASAASMRANTYLDEQGFPDHTVTITGDVVSVVIRHPIGTVLLHLVGVQSKTVTAVGDAQPISGISQAGG